MNEKHIAMFNEWIEVQKKYEDLSDDNVLLAKTAYEMGIADAVKEKDERIKILEEAYLLMRAGLNYYRDKSITGNQVDLALGSEIPIENYKERMRDYGSWEKVMTLAKGDWVKENYDAYMKPKQALGE